MKLEIDRPRRLFGLLPLIAFVIAAQGQALGLEHCPLHDALPGSAYGTVSVDPLQETGSALTHGDHESPFADDHSASTTHSNGGSPTHHAAAPGSHDHTSGPGGCMECGIGSGLGTMLEPGTEASIPSLHDRVGPIARDIRVMGPRHLPFELHLPNAPPPSA